MKAWLLEGFDGLSSLRLASDVARPEVASDQVLVRIRYAALNPADRFLSEKMYPATPPLPHILGRDGCGVIEEVGREVTAWKVGDRVTLLRGEAGVQRWGTLAEFLVVPQEVLVPIPDGWDDPQAAAAPLVYLTAHQALTQWGPVEDGVVLITGVSGGVGMAALHLAKAMGHRVIGLTRGTAKHEKLLEQGADLLLDPTDADPGRDQDSDRIPTPLKQQIKAFTEKKGVNIVVDNIGGELFSTLLDVMANKGGISTIGALGGPVPSFNTAKLIFKRTKIGGVYVNDYYGHRARSAWTEILALLTKVGKKPVVDSIFPMGELLDAFAHLAQGPIGKVVIKIAEQSLCNPSARR